METNQRLEKLEQEVNKIKELICFVYDELLRYQEEYDKELEKYERRIRN